MKRSNEADGFASARINPGCLLNETDVISAISDKWKALSTERALLVGISGIDAAGKGFIAARLAESLERRGLKPAVINADGWLNLPPVRLARPNPSNSFYENAIRFEEMFNELVLPLRDRRSMNVEADFAEETANTFRKHRYEFHSADIVLLEGIFLFKPAYRHHFDFTVWIDCSFATALKRAITRSQENLPPRETEQAFEAIYFPAQRIHIERDNPIAGADIVLSNDQPRLLDLRFAFTTFQRIDGARCHCALEALEAERQKSLLNGPH